MKKRLLSMLLAFGLLTSVLPMNAVAKGAEFGFLNAVTYELPVVAEGEFIAGEVDLPTQSGTGFIGELSGDMPEIREDGFLAEPTAPLKTFPTSGTLMNEVGEPDPAATPITTAEELAAMKSGGQGDRYTVRIRGKQSYLYFERSTNQTGNNIGRWFVERK